MEYEFLPSHTRVVSEEEQKGVYEIDGLYPGYGHTLGNSIRRILLSSLPGAAVTKVKIDGVSHEFAKLPGALEDVITILLNIKQLRFQMHGDEPQVCTIDIKGQKEVRGKDIKCPTQIEVVNGDHHLVSLSDKNARFTAECTVERGIGFVPADELQKEKVSVGTLILDAIFTPIRRANYEVENMRVGDRTDFNRLRLTIESDGTITPREALKRVLSLMKKQIEVIESFEDEGGSAPRQASKESNGGGRGLDSLKISQRVKNALIAHGVTAPEELSSKSEDDILLMEGMGEKAISEIKKALNKLGLSLRE